MSPCMKAFTRAELSAEVFEARTEVGLVTVNSEPNACERDRGKDGKPIRGVYMQRGCMMHGKGSKMHVLWPAGLRW